MSVKNIMKKLGNNLKLDLNTLENGGRYARGARNKVFEKVNRRDASSLAEWATGVKLTSGAVPLGIGAMALYAGGKTLGDSAAEYEHGTITGDIAANTINTEGTGINSPMLRADLGAMEENSNFHQAYSEENINRTNNAVSADIVFALHNLR